MAISENELKHLGGEGIVAKRWYADADNEGQAKVYTSLPNDEELEAWQEAAFTNGGPLVKIELIWSPREAGELSDAKLKERDRDG